MDHQWGYSFQELHTRWCELRKTDRADSRTAGWCLRWTLPEGWHGQASSGRGIPFQFLLEDKRKKYVPSESLLIFSDGDGECFGCTRRYCCQSGLWAAHSALPACVWGNVQEIIVETAHHPLLFKDMVLHMKLGYKQERLPPSSCYLHMQ